MFSRVFFQEDGDWNLQKRQKTKAELKEEANEYQKFLKSRQKGGRDATTDALMKFWKDDNVSEGEKFLRYPAQQPKSRHLCFR